MQEIKPSSKRRNTATAVGEATKARNKDYSKIGHSCFRPLLSFCICRDPSTRLFYNQEGEDSSRL